MKNGYFIFYAKIHCISFFKIIYHLNFYIFVYWREIFKRSVPCDSLSLFQISKFYIGYYAVKCITISVLCQTEIVIWRRHILNRAVRQGWWHHSLNIMTKEEITAKWLWHLLFNKRQVKSTCANCCTLACNLAGDCFISSASLSLNFLNILSCPTRGCHGMWEIRDSKYVESKISQPQECERRTEQCYVNLDWDWWSKERGQNFILRDQNLLVRKTWWNREIVSSSHFHSSDFLARGKYLARNVR